jgi:hypothetical protein
VGLDKALGLFHQGLLVHEVAADDEVLRILPVSDEGPDPVDHPLGLMGLPLSVRQGPQAFQQILLICWSRILDLDEALIVVNGNGIQAAGTRQILTDANLNGANAAMTVVANTSQAANPPAFTGPHPVGSSVQVDKMGDGTTFVTVQSIGPSEVLVLINRPNPEIGAILP